MLVDSGAQASASSAPSAYTTGRYRDGQQTARCGKAHGTLLIQNFQTETASMQFLLADRDGNAAPYGVHRKDISPVRQGLFH
jgi:hypothetical protein